MSKRKPLDRRFMSLGDQLKVAENNITRTLREHLTPEAVATIIAFLQPAAFYKPANADALDALQQVEWFTEVLTEMLGAEESSRLMDELGL